LLKKNNKKKNDLWQNSKCADRCKISVKNYAPHPNYLPVGTKFEYPKIAQKSQTFIASFDFNFCCGK
jgi:hypothetical protein